MIDLEERAVGRLSGPRIVALSLAVGLCGVGPLLLYALLGPADGNPVGLALLAMAAVPVAGVGLLVGLVKTAVEWAGGR